MAEPLREKAMRYSTGEVAPMPTHDEMEPLSFEREFVKEEYERLCFGLIPRSMDDRWFIFLEDDWLYFFRSWLLTFAYAVRIEQAGEKYRVAESWVSKSWKRRTLNELISMFLDGQLGG
jgi:hypothetical protein